MRIMAIDYGDARTGVAISDPTGLLAGYTEVIHSRKGEQVCARLAELVEQYKVEELVMGFPRNMDGTEGPRAELYRNFAGEVAGATGKVFMPKGPTSKRSSRPQNSASPTTSSTPAARK